MKRRLSYPAVRMVQYPEAYRNLLQRVSVAMPRIFRFFSSQLRSQPAAPAC